MSKPRPPIQPPPQAPLSSSELFAGGQRFARLTTLLCLLCAFCLVVAWVVQRRIPPPAYNLVVGRTVTPLEISETPVLSNPKVQAWALRAVGDIFTFGFRDADAHLAAMRPYFTNPAWVTFNGAIGDTKLYSTVRDNSIRVQVTPLQDAYVAAEPQIQFGKTVWPRVEVPVLISYIGAFAKGSAPPPVKQTMVLSLVEVDLAESPDGIQISSLQPTPYKGR
jgi:hypothetical protein